jgi:dUTP pyrophosphatase
MEVLYIKRLAPDVPVPEYKTFGSAGLDLAIREDVHLWPHETKRVSTGLAISIPRGYVGHIHARSSMFYRGLDLDGVIDSDYRGEVMLQIRNTSDNPIKLEAGLRVAQLLIQPVVQPVVQVVVELDETERGEGGFGSTGR